MLFKVDYLCKEGKGSKVVFADSLTEAALKEAEKDDLRLISIEKIPNKCEYCKVATISDDDILCRECTELVYQTAEPEKDLLGRINSEDLKLAEQENKRREEFRRRLSETEAGVCRRGCDNI